MSVTLLSDDVSNSKPVTYESMNVAVDVLVAVVVVPDDPPPQPTISNVATTDEKIAIDFRISTPLFGI
jgi:hypothetical protein